MDIEKLEKIVKIFEDSSMMEFTFEEGDTKLKMDKKGHPVGPAEIAAAQMAAMPLMPAAAAPAASAAAPQVEEETGEEYITSPIVGTFYSAPSPEAKAFVKVGDHVKAGQTVCILEAMKLMNEIESDFDCEIEAVLVSNEQKVEYGQPLFRIRKL